MIFRATDLNLGLLSDVKKQVVLKQDHKSTIYGYRARNLRGILFTKEEEQGKDLHFPHLDYPILSDSSIINERTMAISNSHSLAPLLRYHGVEELDSCSLPEYIEDVILNKEWLRANQTLFGVKYYGGKFAHLAFEYWPAVLPRELGHLLHKVQHTNGISVTQRELKLLDKI